MALEILLDWLEHTDVPLASVEADDTGALDDVAALGAGTLVLRQVKSPPIRVEERPLDLERLMQRPLARSYRENQYLYFKRLTQCTPRSGYILTTAATPLVRSAPFNCDSVASGRGIHTAFRQRVPMRHQRRGRHRKARGVVCVFFFRAPSQRASRATGSAGKVLVYPRLAQHRLPPRARCTPRSTPAGTADVRTAPGRPAV